MNMKISELIRKKQYTKWIINNSPYDDVYSLIDGDLVNVGGISMGELYTIEQILNFNFKEFKVEDE